MSRKTRILVGAPANVPNNVFEAHIASLARQELPAGVEMVPLYVINNPDEEAVSFQTELVQKYGGRVAVEDPLDPADYDPTGDTHHWTDAGFEYVAQIKQSIIQTAIVEGFDYWWLVDADLICDRRTLHSLLATAELAGRRSPVSAVFWTRWKDDLKRPKRRGPVGPNLWMEHPNTGAERPEVVSALVKRQIMAVAGSGACTLFPTQVLSTPGVRYWPRLPFMPAEGSFWSAEDRVMAVTGEVMGVTQLVDPWPDVWHAYGPEERTNEWLVEATKDTLRPLRQFAMPTDRLSILLSPGGILRGRLKDLPEPLRALILDPEGPWWVGEPRTVYLDGREHEAILLDAKVVDLPPTYGREGNWVDAPDLSPPPQEAPEGGWGTPNLVEL